MDEQRFALASGNVAHVTPGVLSVTITATCDVRSIDLAGAQVLRDGAAVVVLVNGERFDLPATTLVDAGQMEVALRTAAMTTVAPTLDPASRPATRWVGIPIWGWIVGGLAVLCVLLVIGAVFGGDDLTEREQTYADRVRVISGDVSDIMRELNALLSNPQPTDPTWRDGITIYSAALIVTADDAANLRSPSDRFDGVHRDFTGSLAALREAAILLDKGVKSGSSSDLRDASAKFDETTRLANRASEGLDDLTD